MDQPLDEDLLSSEWERLKAKLDTKSWTAGDHGNAHSFFCHGWYGRTGNASYQQEPQEVQPKRSKCAECPVRMCNDPEGFQNDGKDCLRNLSNPPSQ